MTTSMDRFINHLWGFLGFSGGATGSLIGWINTDQAITAVVLAAIGGTVGTLVGLIIKELWCWCKSKMK